VLPGGNDNPGTTFGGHCLLKIWDSKKRQKFSVLYNTFQVWLQISLERMEMSTSDKRRYQQQFLLCWTKNLVNFGPLRACCTNVVHDLGSAKPKSKVEPSSRWITLHQNELGSADPVQLNGCGYTVDWSTTLGLRVNYSDVTVTRNAYETVQYKLAVICSNFKLSWSYHTIFTSTLLHDKVLKIRILCSNRYSSIILRPLSR